MSRTLEGYAKFVLKVRFVGILRSIFLFFFGLTPRRENWEQRLLIIYLQAIGDAVVLTSVLKHYREAFPGKKLYMLIPAGKGVEDVVRPFVHEIIELRYRAFIVNPFYGYSFVNRLRLIGFETVVDQNHSPAEVAGKVIATSVGASKVYGYEGFLLPFERPFDLNMELTVRYVRASLYPRFTDLVPSIDRKAKRKIFNHLIEHYVAFFEAISGKKIVDYRTVLDADPTATERVERMLKEKNIKRGSYVILNPGSSQAWKNWPLERFCAVSKVFREKDIPMVLIGAPGEEGLGISFQGCYTGKYLDLIGRTAVAEVIALIDGARMVLTNDTAAVHIAVARKKPSVCILGGGHFGKISLYGYSDINKWVYTETDCFGDNWRCAAELRGASVAPCIRAVTTEQVRVCIVELLEYLARTGGYPKSGFKTSHLS